jgi:type I restriction enzyme S subunit
MKAGKNISAKNIFDSESPQHQYPCFGGNGIRGYVSECNEHGDFPIIGRQGALCGNIQMAKGDFYATEHAVVVTSKGLYRQRYLYYLLTVMNLNQYKSAGAQPGLAVGKLETIFAPVPSLEQQDNTVKILDQFNRLCNDLYIGLPAEIEARQKQYEYYRDKLLTFREKA